LRKFFKTDYRGIVAILRDHSDLRQVLGLTRVPHFTTLQKAACRLMETAAFRGLLRRTLKRVMGRRRKVDVADCDSSGLACGHASRYYVNRRAKGQDKGEKPAQSTTYKRYAKLELMLDTATHLIRGALAGRGPSPDVDRLVPLMGALDPMLKLGKLVADAGYDSERNHVFARIGCGIQPLMPALHGRRGQGPPKGR
jgi:hypothetical protein